MEEYCRLLDNGEVPIEAGEVLTREQFDLESLFLGFRMTEGVAVELVERLDPGGSVLARLRESGLVKVVGGRVMPTRRGFLVADSLPLLFDH